MNKKIAASIMSLLMIAMAMPVMAVDTNPAVVTGSVAVHACPIGTIGMTTDVATMDFGELYPGQVSGSNDITLSITSTGFYGLDCQNPYGYAPTDIDVTVSAGDWVGALGSEMIADSTVISGDVSEFDLSTSLPVDETSILSFIVAPPEDQTPDTYTQTITISAMY